MTLELNRERYSPTGGLHAAGISNLLGRPHHDPLATLIREAFQNSWDVRLPGAKVMSIRILGIEADKRRTDILRKEVFAHAPPGTAIATAVTSPSVSRMLLVVDRGTAGLSGPYRIEDEVPKGQKPHFRDFVWVWGGRHEVVQGGTYGYGKSALYNASKAKTIIVHTRCEWRRELQERLIVCSIHVGEKDQRYTGRLWWGSVGKGDGFGPLVGPQAAALAKRIGLPSFSGQDTGTTIAIIDPVGDMKVTDEIQRLGDEAAKWFWPRMSQGEMFVECQVDGGDAWQPDLNRWPLPEYRRAFEAIMATRSGGDPGEGTRIHAIELHKPPVTLGHLAFRRIALPQSASAPSPEPDEGDDSESDDDPTQTRLDSQAVALMRGPQMVVRYMPAGGAAATPDLGWVAVFVAIGQDVNADVEAALAASEPPAHDDWIADARRIDDKRKRRFVNMAIKRIKEAIWFELAPIAMPGPEAAETPMAALSRDLGGLTAGVDVARGPSRVGEGSRRANGGAGGGGGDGASAVTIRPAGRPRLRREGELTVVQFDYDITTLDPDRDDFRLDGEVGAIVDGGAIEADAPQGAEAPTIVGWIHDGRRVRDPHPMPRAGRWTLEVSTPSGLMVGAKVRAVQATGR